MKSTKQAIGIVIPYYNAAAQIETVVHKAIQYAETVVVVDDNSLERLPKSIREIEKVVILKTNSNLGVGGATKCGFEYLLSLSQIEVIVKLDADNQMDTGYIPELVKPIFEREYDFVKGNRFRDFKALKQMPPIRRFGNLVLSFLSKGATGYWNCFDFNNGFFSIATKNLKLIEINSLSNTYFFETSLIASLYYQHARILEVPMPAIYGNEKSNMKIFKMPFVFMGKLFKIFFERIWKAYFVYDFNIGTLYILFGLPLFLGGVSFGGYNWYHYSSQGILTPLGTIMISAILIILGFQLLLQAVQFDIFKTPSN